MFFAFRVPVGRFAKKTTLFLGAIFMPVIMLGEAEVLDIVLALFFSGRRSWLLPLSAVMKW